MASKSVRIAPGAGSRQRLLTGRLYWSSRAQERKAALMSIVSESRPVISFFKKCVKGCSELPVKTSPASTPHRKSSPLGVRPMPNPRRRDSSAAAFWKSFVRRNSLQCRIKFLAADKMRDKSSSADGFSLNRSANPLVSVTDRAVRILEARAERVWAVNGLVILRSRRTASVYVKR